MASPTCGTVARRTQPRKYSCAALLSLDYLIERPSLGWLPTEADKVQRFEALGIDRGTFPYRMYGPEGKPQIPRYFAFKLPIAVDEKTATFVYVDAGADHR